MKKTAMVLTALLAALVAVAAPSAQALPRQMVVIVAEGVNPQVLDMGTNYVKTAYEQGTTVALDDLKAQGKAGMAGADVLAGMKGILKTAAANGYKTGLVTTEDVSKVAPLFYDLPNGDAGTLIAAPIDFLAGGGRAALAPLAKQLTDAGGNALFDIESLDKDIKGKTFALQSDAALDYAIDRDAEKGAGFGELASLALQTLSQNNAPFILVLHDTLMARALAARDTPALMQQFRELDSILSEISGLREENPTGMGVALVATGGTVAPRFTTEVAGERAEAAYILSQLPMSYAGAGASLQGADDAKITAFTTGQYKGWKLSPENRAALLGGTMTGEAAIRASYEPALKIAFETVEAQPMVVSAGLDGDNILEVLKNLAMTKPA